MTVTVLGKIESVDFGKCKDYPFMFGLQITFHLADGCGIGCGGKYTVNVSDSCRWEKSERQEKITKMIDGLNKLLSEAKVNYVSELVNKPVEVEIEDNCFKNFRILTEVL